MNVTIPVNTKALIYLPYSQGSVINLDGKEISGTTGVEFAGIEDGRKIFRIGSGEYRFEILY
jgi:alpha-L-rhamnosidase